MPKSTAARKKNKQKQQQNISSTAEVNKNDFLTAAKYIKKCTSNSINNIKNRTSQHSAIKKTLKSSSKQN